MITQILTSEVPSNRMQPSRAVLLTLLIIAITTTALTIAINANVSPPLHSGLPTFREFAAGAS